MTLSCSCLPSVTGSSGTGRRPCLHRSCRCWDWRLRHAGRRSSWPRKCGSFNRWVGDVHSYMCAGSPIVIHPSGLRHLMLPQLAERIL